jgi:hemerythrin superfamily protein
MAKDTSKQLDAVQMLKADHKLVKKLFEQYRSASDHTEKRRIAGNLFSELIIHAALEEEIFYPAVRSQLEPADLFISSDEGNGLDLSETGEEDKQDFEADDIDGIKLEEEGDEAVIAQAYEEHQVVEELIEQLKTLDPKSSDYQELFTELEDAVLEHISGEENVILPVAASQLDVQTLGIAMQRRRDDLSSSLAA